MPVARVIPSNQGVSPPSLELEGGNRVAHVLHDMLRPVMSSGRR